MAAVKAGFATVGTEITKMSSSLNALGVKMGAAGTPKSPATESPTGSRAALVSALVTAFNRTTPSDRITITGDVNAGIPTSGLSAALRERLSFHQLLTGGVRFSDFVNVEVDGAGVAHLSPSLPADKKGLSMFVVLSSHNDVLSAAHALRRVSPKLSHSGCCVRPLSTLPDALVITIDGIQEKDGSGGVPIIAHASLTPKVRMTASAFQIALDQWAATKCAMAANADDPESHFHDDGEHLHQFSAVSAPYLVRKLTAFQEATTDSPVGGSPPTA